MAKSAFRGSPRAAMGGGMGGNNAMMRQVQKMQEDMLAAQSEVETATFDASAGGGAVSATVSGKKELRSLTISPDAITVTDGAVDVADVEMLQDMIVAAVNEAMRKADTAMESKMGRFNVGLPGLF